MTGRVEHAASWAVPTPPDLRDAFAHAPAALAVTTLAGTIIWSNTALAEHRRREAQLDRRALHDPLTRTREPHLAP